MKSRLFRALVCLLVICCLIVNISPIKTKAVVAEVLSTAAILALGYAGVLILASAGVVVCPKSQADFRVVGNSLQSWMDDYCDTDEKAEEFTAWVNSVNTNFFGDDPDDPSDDPIDPKFKLARGILAGIVGWVCSVITTGLIDQIEAVEAPEGYAYYNGVLLPDISLLSTYANYQFCFIQAKSDGSYYLRMGRDGFYRVYGSIVMPRFGSDDKTFWYTYKCTDGLTWDYSSFSSKQTTVCKLEDILWSNFNLTDADGTEIFFLASDPVYVGTETIIVEPSVYVGDIPQQVQDGTLAEEDVSLPDIDFSNFMLDGETAEEAVTRAMNELAAGTLTYEDYLDQTKFVEDTDTDTDTDTDPVPTTSPDADTDVDTEDSPSTELSDYTLDLRDFFPFCIPFDIFEFISLLDADPVAPCFEFTFNFGEYLGVHTLTIDLAQWDGTAQLLRRLELLLFIVGLAMATRNYYIRG